MNKKVKYKEKLMNFFKGPFLYLIIIIIFIQRLIYSNIPEVGRTGDTDGYIHAYDSGSIFEGYVSDLRPPVYTYFIKVVEKIGGEENLEANVARAQEILFFLSIILFYSTIKLLTKNKLIICILTLIFGIAPSVIIWNSFIVTESITGLEMLFLTYITIKYLKRPSKVLASLIGIVVLGMILTKPAFIYLLPIYILFIVLKYFLNKEERKKIYFAAGSLAICCVALVMYCLQMKNLYGVFGLTSVSSNNTMLSAIYSGSYLELKDNSIGKEIYNLAGEEPVTELETYEIYYDEIVNKYTSDEIKEFAKEAVKTNIYREYLINRFINVGNENIGITYSNGEKSDEGTMYNFRSISGLIIPITFGFVYIILVVSIIYLIWYIIKYKEINWICAFFTSTIFANIVTLIFGAPFEEQRLFFPSMCLVLLYIGVIIERIKLKDENLSTRKNA